MSTLAVQTELTYSPILSSQNRGWENILVKHYQHPAGEALCQLDDDHTICMSLAPRPVRFLHIKDGKPIPVCTEKEISRSRLLKCAVCPLG
ncbi:MAG: hypothetical protein HC899_24160 [Leptolyngbyaceae cyanobacterium SM1_4_3]|nr:hypothetical protein [Leptolyngbyaceae cyanobacterium SM1_4_3]